MVHPSESGGKRAVRNIVSVQATDTVISTPLTILNGIEKDKTAGEIARDVIIDELTNLGLNMAIAGVDKFFNDKFGISGASVGDGESGASILSTEDAEEIAFNAIKGENKADAVVLGKYGDGDPAAYTFVAKDMDAQYFQLDNWDELALKYSDDEIWKINEKFLDIQTSSGREIYLSHNPVDYIGDGSFYSKEIQYLLDNGYAFIEEGGIWHAVR